MIINANALQIPLADKSVHMIVTSPPYWGLRDYGTAKWEGGDNGCDHSPARKNGKESSTLSGGQNGNSHEQEPYRSICGKCGAIRIDNQLGLERTPEEYIANMVAVFRECWRVLRDDGTLWLNIGDSYNGSGGAGGDYADGGLKDGQPKYNGRDYSGLKHKDLVGIPWRLAFALQADGWYLRSDIIWNKPNPMPESVTDRPTKSHEYLFLLAKRERYYYDAEAIKEDAIFNGPPAMFSNGVGGRANAMDREPSGNEKPGVRWERVTTRNRRSVWTIPTMPYSGVSVYGTYRITSQDCPVHDYQEDRLSVLEYDGQLSVFDFLRSLDTGNYHASTQEGAVVSIPLYHRELPLDDFFAIPHNMRMNKMEDELKQDVIFFGISTSHTEYTRLVHRSISKFCRKNGNKTLLDAWLDETGLDPSVQTIYRTFGIVTFDPPPDGCTCHYNGKVEKRQDHFAVFPPALVEPCIKAGTSERGVCPKCGKGWRRVVEKNYPPEELFTKHNLPDDGLVHAGIRKDGSFRGSGQKVQNWLNEHPAITTDWQPACTCGQDNGGAYDPVPAIVFDPFVGSGTTVKVAYDLGRRGVGLDLSLEYLDGQARTRIHNGHTGRLL